MAHELTARDAAALERLLAQHPDDAVGTVLRLAWGEGLTREEIVRLTWDRVDLNALVLRLPAREVPLSEESARCLRARLRRGAAPETHVVRSDQRNAPLAPQSVSRLARAALDGAGLEAVGLRDLRADFIRRAFAAHDWAHALRLSGLSVTT